MANSSEIFSKEYVSGTQTTIEKKETDELKQIEVEIDTQKYSTSKPRRKIIRAKLIYGKD